MREKISYFLGTMVMTVVSFFSFLTPVFAETTNVAVPLIDKYPLGNYEAITFVRWHIRIFGSEGLAEMGTGLANFFFTITKLIVDTVDYGIEYLYGINAINALADQTINAADKIWSSLYDNFGEALLIVAGLVIFCTFAFKSPQKAFRQFGQLCIVLMLSFGFMAAGGTILKSVNNVALDAQSKIMSAGTGMETDAVTQMRNKYFETTVMDPFLLMNFGTTNEDQIKEKDPERIDRILNQPSANDGDFGDLDVKVTQDELEKKEKSYENVYMSASYASYKLTIALFSVVIAIGLGIPVLGISFANFFAQILILAMAWLMPFLMIISLIPRYSNAALNGFKKMGLGFVAMMFFGVIMMGLFYLIDTIKIILPGSDTAGYLLQSACIIVSIFLIIKNRHKIIKSLSNDIVSNAGYKGLKEADDFLSGKASETAKDLRDKLFGNNSASEADDEHHEPVPAPDVSRSEQTTDEEDQVVDETELDRTDQAEELESEEILDDSEEESTDEEELPSDLEEPLADEELPLEAEESLTDEDLPLEVEESLTDEELPPEAEESLTDEELPPETEESVNEENLSSDLQETIIDEELPLEVEEPLDQEVPINASEGEVVTDHSVEEHSQEVEQIQNSSSGLHDTPESEASDDIDQEQG